MSRNFRVGVFIVAALSILGTGIFLIGSKDLRFHSTYEIRAQFPNVAGLQVGAEVRVGGIHEGAVKRIDLPSRPGREVTVEMDLEPDTRKAVNGGSVASIDADGLLGEKYVEISFGPPDGGTLRSGGMIQSVPPIGISDLIKQANVVLNSTNDSLNNVKGATHDLEDISSKIDEGKGTVGALINDKDLYRRIDSGASAFADDMEALKHNFLVRGFINQRGYEDSTELAQHHVARLPAEAPVATYQFDDSKIFDKADSAKLRDEKALNKAGDFLESNPFSLAVVADSEGPLGDSDKDRTLSEARSMVVREYLVNHFRLDDTRIKTLPIGKTGTAGDIPRVEIVAYPAAAAQREAQIAKR